MMCLEEKDANNKESREALTVLSLGWNHCKDISNKSVFKLRPGYSKSAKLSLLSFTEVVHNSWHPFKSPMNSDIYTPVLHRVML